MEGDISDNVCKLYLTENLVIIHPSEFKKKEDVVDFAVGMIKDGKKKDFKGGLRKDIKPNEDNPGVKRQKIEDDGKIDTVTEDERILDEIQFNTFFLLNERNKIIFLLSVMNELRSRKSIKSQDELLGTIATTTKRYYDKLSKVVRERQNSYELKYWEDFIRSPSFKNVEHFLIKEETIVRHELASIDKVARKSE